MKVYTGFSARRFDCDVQAAQRQGLIGSAPSFTSVNRYIADPDLTPILTDLIERSAAPLSIVESQSPPTVRASPPAGSTAGLTTNGARRSPSATGSRPTLS